jgi:hypothetical protein
MPDVRFGEQSKAERAIRSDCATCPAKVAASAQCHTLDATGQGVGTCPEKGVVSLWVHHCCQSELVARPMVRANQEQAKDRWR